MLSLPRIIGQPKPSNHAETRYFGPIYLRFLQVSLRIASLPRMPGFHIVVTTREKAILTRAAELRLEEKAWPHVGTVRYAHFGLTFHFLRRRIAWMPHASTARWVSQPTIDHSHKKDTYTVKTYALNISFHDFELKAPGPARAQVRSCDSGCAGIVELAMT
eukprot:4272453-Pleurochrysis_carterae.AAC.1